MSNVYYLILPQGDASNSNNAASTEKTNVPTTVTGQMVQIPPDLSSINIAQAVSNAISSSNFPNVTPITPIVLNVNTGASQASTSKGNTERKTKGKKKLLVLAPHRSSPLDHVTVEEKPTPEVIVNTRTTKEMANKKLFDDAIAMNYLTRPSGNSGTKPEWSRERINMIIKLIKEYKVAPSLGKTRTQAQYNYASKYDVLNIGGKDILILKRKSTEGAPVEIVPSDQYYDILNHAHLSTGHGGRDKILRAIKPKYVIPSSIVNIFTKSCTVCQSKKEYKKDNVVEVPDFYLNRGKVELFDMRDMPDGPYNWILHYQDDVSRFSILRAMKSNELDEIATELLKIFLEIGCPGILETCSREFSTALISKLESTWPQCKILNGKPKSDISEEIFQIKDLMKSWLNEEQLRNWSIGIYHLQFKKNNSINKTIKQIPFKVIFGKKLKLGSRIIKVNTEEDLEELVSMSSKDKLGTKMTDSMKEFDCEDEEESVESNSSDIEEAEIYLPSNTSNQNSLEMDPIQIKIENLDEKINKKQEILPIEIENIKREKDEAVHIEIEEQPEDNISNTKITSKIDIEIDVNNEYADFQTKRMKKE